MRHAAEDPHLWLEPVKWFGWTLLNGIGFVVTLILAESLSVSPAGAGLLIIAAIIWWVLFAASLALFSLALVDYVRARRRQ